MSTKLTRSTLGVEDVLMRSDTPEQGGANEKSYMFAIWQCVFIHLVSDIWSVDLKFVLSAGDSLSMCVCCATDVQTNTTLNIKSKDFTVKSRIWRQEETGIFQFILRDLKNSNYASREFEQTSLSFTFLLPLRQNDGDGCRGKQQQHESL